MHILEAFIFILSMTMLILIISKRSIKTLYIVLVLVATSLVFILHLIFDGTRWQLFPLYFATLVLMATLYLKTVNHIDVKKYIKKGLIIVLSLLVLISLGSAAVFPIYKLPTPNGDYLIGTESFVIVDESRQELYGNEDHEFRKIKIQFWYPAETTDGYQQAPWLEDGLVVSRALSRDTGLPFFVLDHATKILSNSYIEAPLNNDLDEYPVIIISHGWRGFRNLHTDFAEELASLGYIVIGIDHSYGSVATVFSDDDIAYLDNNALPPRETNPDFLDYANQLVNTYGADITFTINYLEDINSMSSSSRFSGKLNLTKIGLLGHSTGGGGSVAVALNDDRIDAVIGLDAWVEPIDSTEISKGLDMPSLFLRSGSWETGYNNINLYDLIESSTVPSLLYQIDGITHYDFAMVYMYSPLTRYIGFTGSVESKYLTSILKSMISDFFNETLKNDTNSEIDPNTWEEVRVITID